MALPLDKCAVLAVTRRPFIWTFYVVLYAVKYILCFYYYFYSFWAFRIRCTDFSRVAELLLVSCGFQEQHHRTGMATMAIAITFWRAVATNVMVLAIAFLQ